MADDPQLTSILRDVRKDYLNGRGVPVGRGPGPDRAPAVGCAQGRMSRLTDSML
jgi:hypothetical protein